LSKGTVSKKSYHHGDLRTALIHAAFELIDERGVDLFSLKQASDRVGVSVAAPYRHFGDKESLVAEVISMVKLEFAKQLLVARDQYPLGSEECVVALGRAYVAFVTERRHLGGLLFGVHEYHVPDDLPDYEGCGDPEGRYPFTMFRQALIAWLDDKGLGAEYLLDLAIPLWTMVHGSAMIKMSGVVNVLTSSEGLDDRLEVATHRFLKGFLASVK